MQMAGEQRIEGPQEAVWAALNDVDTLRKCIPGCQSLERLADDRMRAIVAVKVGPITARFTGDVTLTDLDPPNGYRIQGEGQGGAAGFAKGGAQVRLAKDGDATLLTYEVDAQVGGKLSQLGGGLIDATAKQMAATFFNRLSKEVGAPSETRDRAPMGAEASAPMPGPGPAAETSAPAPAARRAAAPSGGQFWVAIAALLAAALAGFLFGRGAAGWDGSGAWAGLAVGLLVVVVAGAAYGVGRRGTPAQVAVIDAQALAQLIDAAARAKGR